MKYCGRTAFMTDADLSDFISLGKEAKISTESGRRMDEGIINNINAVVQPNDQLYCLGDWCFSKRETYLDVARSYLDRIHCQNVHLIWGNHDRKSLLSKVGFASCMGDCTIETEGHEFFLSHYPHVSWDKNHWGVFHLHGHVHGLYHNSPPVRCPESWAAFDVGVDVEQRYGVWSVPELVERLREKAQAARRLR